MSSAFQRPGFHNCIVSSVSLVSCAQGFIGAFKAQDFFYMAFQVFLQFLNIQDFLGDWYSGFHGCIMSSISQISSSHGFRSYMSASCQVLSSIQGFIGVWRQVFPWFIVPTASQVPLKFRIFLCSVSSVSLVLLISRISEKTGIQGFMGVSCQVFAWFIVPTASQVPLKFRISLMQCVQCFFSSFNIPDF